MTHIKKIMIKKLGELKQMLRHLYVTLATEFAGHTIRLSDFYISQFTYILG